MDQLRQTMIERSLLVSLTIAVGWAGQRLLLPTSPYQLVGLALLVGAAINFVVLTKQIMGF
jgi:hypothetical protein